MRGWLNRADIRYMQQCLKTDNEHQVIKKVILKTRGFIVHSTKYYFVLKRYRTTRHIFSPKRFEEFSDRLSKLVRANSIFYTNLGRREFWIQKEL